MASVPVDRIATLNTALAGRYEIQRELGSGGMAVVYLAHDARHDRPVALKILRPEVAAEIGAERFEREIRIAARLSHPHILALYDSGAVHGFLYYVMPYIAGESLRTRIEKEGRLPVADTVRLLRQVAAALEHAHSQGLVHRDIKPENVLLHAGEALVADFGIALALSAGREGRITSSGFLVGTPEYMSPEQAAGDPELDARSDIYSLGCVGYEMLCGSPPFTGASPRAVMARRFTEPPPPIAGKRREVPPAVEQAILRALAQDPSGRYATAREFADALAASEPEEPSTPSVAVLPFLSFSSDPENEFFSEGITEDVIAQLAKIGSLKVISRASVMAFREREQRLRDIGAALGVSAVLDGSVRRAGNRVRIVAQLVDARTDEHLWAETYDRDLTDIFAIQSDVALQIAKALDVRLSGDERRRIRQGPTANLKAYQFYVQGRHWYSRYSVEGTRKAIEYYGQAIAEDPGFAAAHSALGLVYAEIGTSQGGFPMKPEQSFGMARQSAERALALDPALGDAYGVLALIKLLRDFDWAGAEADFRHALSLSPGSADLYDHYGWLCGAMTRFDEALALVRRAKELDPLAHTTDVASVLLRAGRYQEALVEAQASIDFDPNLIRAHSTLGWALIKLGRSAEGIAQLEKAVGMSVDDSMFRGQLGEAYGLTGERDKALALLRELQEIAERHYVPPYHFAYIHTGLADYDRAMDCLEQAYEARAGGLYGIKGSFLFQPLRDHPRFKALLRRMNLDA